MADSWSDSNSSSSESSSLCTKELDFAGDGDDSEEEPANEKTMVNMDQDVSDGCTCMCKDYNHSTVRAVQTLVKVERSDAQHVRLWQRQFLVRNVDSFPEQGVCRALRH